ncbi:MAG TPA: MauE/DoxX family redox-associated membrane protein [Actinocrinis sp.]|nr:MauE/DoxX family redox-associated membrane protein [Actinocrinis sp.]
MSRTNPATAAKPVPATGTPGFYGSRIGPYESWISLVARLYLGGMWLFYSIPKLTSPDSNEISVRAFRLLPNSLINPFAYGQPYVELAFGLLLIAGLGTRLVALFSALLLLVYIGGIISLGARGIQVQCGCGGTGGALPPGVHTRYILDTLRDLGYMLFALWLLWRPDSRFSADGVLLPPIE